MTEPARADASAPAQRRSLKQRLATFGVMSFTHFCYYALRAIVWLPFQIDCLRQRLRKPPESGR